MFALSKVKVILIAAIITTAILVPVLMLTGRQHGDSTAPVVTILSPTPTTYYSDQITINISTDDTDVDTIWYRIYSQAAGDWVDASNLTWSSSTPRTLSADGFYILYVWANDTAGNTAQAEWLGFTIDALPPDVPVLSPVNTTYTSQTTQITININDYDLSIDTIWYRIYNETEGAWVDPTNLTWTPPTYRTLGSGGVFTVYVWANDTQGRTTMAPPVTFTMIHEIIYSGDHAFTSDFVVGLYEKVIFQDGHFSITTTEIFVQGALEMHNVIWTSTVDLNAYSTVTATNTTFTACYFYDNGIVALDNTTFEGTTQVYDNTVLTLTDSVVTANFYVRNDAQVTINDCSFYRLYGYDNAEINASFSSSSSINQFYGASKIILRNYTISTSISMNGDSQLTAINSTLSWVISYNDIWSGTWTLSQGVLSGSGSVDWSNVTFINTEYAQYDLVVDSFGSSEVVIEDTEVYNILAYDNANVSVYNCSSTRIEYNDDSIGTLSDVTVNILNFLTNQTVLMQDTSVIVFMAKYYRFYEGNIVGYNDTYTGAVSWANTTIIDGGGNSIPTRRYGYETHDQVDLTVYNTSIEDIATYDQTNVSLYSSSLGSATTFSDSNLTLYYSYLSTYISAQTNSNVTLYNSTGLFASVQLYNSAFASIINHSYLYRLTLSGTSAYYKSPDSTILNPP